jgi:hypothetical protein
MIGCNVLNMITCGVRDIAFRFRHAMVSASATAQLKAERCSTIDVSAGAVMAAATGQVLVDCGVLAGETDAHADLVRRLAHIEPEDLGASTVGTKDRGQDSNRGGLARAVRTEQAEHGALRDGQVDTVQGHNVPKHLTKPSA